MPWIAIPHVNNCLRAEGKVCTFSPCIEQIDKTAAELRRHRYRDIRMFETLAVNWGVREQAAPKKRKLTAAAGRAAAAEEKDAAQSPAELPNTASATPASSQPTWVSY